MNTAYRVVWVPFRDYEKCIKVFSNIVLESMSINTKLILNNRNYRRRTTWTLFWETYENELRVYHYFIHNEMVRRNLAKKGTNDIDWNMPKGLAPWQKSDLFFLSQKIGMLRSNAFLYSNFFFVKNFKQWPKGLYFPIDGIGSCQKETNKLWEDYFEEECSGKLKNTDMLLRRDFYEKHHGKKEWYRIPQLGRPKCSHPTKLMRS